MMNQEQKFYTYKYSYPNGTPFYVGKGTGKRWKVHLSLKKRPPTMFYRVLTKLQESGIEPIVEKIVDKVDEEFAIFVEQEFIRKHGRRDIGTGTLTNHTDGGEGVVNNNPEAEERRREALRKAECDTRFKKGQRPEKAILVLKGKPSWNKGRAWDEETRKRISAKVTEIMKDPARREKTRQMALGNTFRRGVPHTEETKAKLREAKLGVPTAKRGRKYPHLSAIHREVAHAFSWECPHCRKQGVGKGAANRWHFDNCKEKQ